MPTVTALRDDRRGRVAVELDGVPWRMLPLDVVVRAGIAEGRLLDRPALRLLRRELRRAEALQVATRALRARDLSTRRLGDRLARAAVPPAAAAESVAALTRAEALAERGYGDAAIRHRLAQEGLPEELVTGAVAGLAGEAERAARLVERRGTGIRTARYLTGRGFGEEAVEAALGARFGHDG